MTSTETERRARWAAARLISKEWDDVTGQRWIDQKYVAARKFFLALARTERRRARKGKA